MNNYKIASIKKVAEKWIDQYNSERAYHGKMCCGRTPMDTLEDGRKIWEEKFVN